MPEIQPKIDIDKRTLRNVIYAMFEGKKRGDLENLGLTFSMKDVTRFSPAKLPELLSELYYKMTGRTITRVLEQSYLETITLSGNTKERHFIKIPSKEVYIKHIPPKATPLCVFDAICIISVDKDNEKKSDILKKRVNVHSFIKDKKDCKTK